MTSLARVCFVLLVLSISVFSQEQQFAELGDFKLTSGEVIRECRVGYRLFGKLNADKSNAIVIWKQAGWGHSMWNLRGSFGVLDSGRKDVQYEDFKSHKLDRKMLELLKSN